MAQPYLFHWHIYMLFLLLTEIVNSARTETVSLFSGPLLLSRAPGWTAVQGSISNYYLVVLVQQLPKLHLCGSQLSNLKEQKLIWVTCWGQPHISWGRKEEDNHISMWFKTVFYKWQMQIFKNVKSLLLVLQFYSLNFDKYCKRNSTDFCSFECG